mmetsp:Transcript_3838/g.5862  ORF Transcript_3838/g.5862 Transcript_3838/m.5862 type:complete len:89 (+) Transcript_3838:402-668(+)
MRNNALRPTSAFRCKEDTFVIPLAPQECKTYREFFGKGKNKPTEESFKRLAVKYIDCQIRKWQMVEQPFSQSSLHPGVKPIPIMSTQS